MSLDKKEGCDEDPGTLSETETGLDCCDGMQPSNPEAEFDVSKNKNLNMILKRFYNLKMVHQTSCKLQCDR